MKRHLIIGVTGGFGTGKTTVADLLEELGAYVVDADKLAHEALMEGSSVYEQVLKIFPEARTADGFDRKKIAAVIFTDAEKRKKLESIVHPYVLERIEEEIVDAEEPVIVLNVPLLFETKLNLRCDKVVVVGASADAVRERLKERGFTEKDMELRAKAQWPLEKKMEKANYVINNSGNLESTRREVEKVWKDLRPVLKGEK